ncbi:MAG TPA: hypothetical protein PKZ92_02865 [Candidatus Woesebacteria bacterium]|jgi:hypothetical protein|nr:hypothetical protein [Candidatus Woesebacteria bacterium]
MNNQLYQKYMNLISDAYRGIYELVDPKIGNKSFFVKNYLKNITLITDKNKNYKKILKINQIASKSTHPKIKAEYLLDNNRIILDFIKQNYAV